MHHAWLKNIHQTLPGESKQKLCLEQWVQPTGAHRARGQTRQQTQPGTRGLQNDAPTPTKQCFPLAAVSASHSHGFEETK